MQVRQPVAVVAPDHLQMAEREEVEEVAELAQRPADQERQAKETPVAEMLGTTPVVAAVAHRLPELLHLQARQKVETAVTELHLAASHTLVVVEALVSLDLLVELAGPVAVEEVAARLVQQLQALSTPAVAVVEATTPAMQRPVVVAS